MNPQPNSKHCFVCGMENPIGLKVRYYDNGSNEVRALYTVESQYQGYPGVAHGGIVAALLDEAAGRVMMIGDPNRFFVTASMTIKYRRPVPTETQLTLIGQLIRDRGRVAQAHSEIRLPDGAICAEAEATLAEFDIDAMQQDANLAALGWKVYPDSGPVPVED